MTLALILAAWTLASIPVALVAGRVIHNRDTPCPGERVAHDARRQSGEAGLFLTNHNQGDTHVG